MLEFLFTSHRDRPLAREGRIDTSYPGCLCKRVLLDDIEQAGLRFDSSLLNSECWKDSFTNRLRYGRYFRGRNSSLFSMSSGSPALAMSSKSWTHVPMEVRS